MSIEVSIYCDGCGVLGGVRRASRILRKKLPVKPHILRAELVADGWRCTIKGGLDLCVDCVADEVSP